MVYKSPPPGFTPKFEVVSCFYEFQGRFLLLQRHKNKPQGGTWGAPAGKVSKGESIEGAMMREFKEETGIDLSEQSLKYFDKVYITFPTFDFIYHLFSAKHEPSLMVKLNPMEHTAHTWVTPEESLKMNLIQDEDGCIKLFYAIE
jgi:8-oxo-dGTP diphosphatase